MAQAQPGMIPCDACSTPALRVVGNTVVVEHRHHGQTHVTVLSIQVLLDKVGAVIVR